ncbi:nucleotidyltransferase family protein [Paenibacillus pasadenensis]|uniref:nucleotidyltransferase domain-containing protein n=1 Tax=Paenibacillus pasadenensis TaxID=217090 RepID=UPI00203CE661|nr:nucleotidyltransferase family protein [Paenibacillus pasadenensis]MCM3749146.1 nucleotidyltransferase family protein [Paenibacillus pasadenensis]
MERKNAMKASEAVRLLDQIYSGERTLGRSDAGWKKAWEDIRGSFTGSQFYHLLQSRDLLEQTPEWLQAELKAESERILYQNMLIRAEQKKLFRAFEQEEIPLLVLKGIRMSERFFGHFAARPTTDIDVLVRPSDLERASALLKQLSFGDGETLDDDHFHLQFNKFYNNPMFPFLAVELHWSIMRSHHHETDLEALWSRTIPLTGYRYVRELNDEDTLYHTALHGFNHHMLSLKYIVDIAQVIDQTWDGFSYESLWNKARLDGNLAKLTAVLSLVYRLCPTLQWVKPLDRRIRWPFWSEQLMREAGVGIKSRRYYLFRLCSIFVTFDHTAAMLSHFKYLFLPPADYARSQFKEEQGGSLLSLYSRIYRQRLGHLLGRRARAGAKELDTP